MHRIETQFAGRLLAIETGRLAKQAAGSAALRFGDTLVLAAVTVSPNISNLPFFPLTVEYREKTYAAGKIPGGFLKREGRPSDKEILASRLIVICSVCSERWPERSLRRTKRGNQQAASTG